MKVLQIIFCVLLVFSSTVFNLAQANLPNQYTLALKTALINLIRGPQELVWFLNSNKIQREYLSKKELTLQKNPNETQYPGSELSCEQKCVDDFSILSSVKKRMSPENGDFLLGFLNKKHDFIQHTPSKLGYCWGHATVTRNVGYLAQFDPEQKIELAPSEDNKRKFRIFYRKKIRKMMLGQVQVIPGFTNTREFSSHPLLINMFKSFVVNQWANRALRFGSIKFLFKGKKKVMSPEKVKKLVQEIQEKLSINHAPLLLFSPLGKPSASHVTVVYDLRIENDQIKICISDNNFYENEIRDCKTNLLITNNYSDIFYAPWKDKARDRFGKIGSMAFTQEDNFNMLRYQRAHHRQCLQRCALKIN